MTYRILRSQSDPSFFLITDDEHYNQAVGDYQSGQPSDHLLPVPEQEAIEVLASVPSLNVVNSVIDFVGYFGHAYDSGGAGPAPAHA